MIDSFTPPPDEVGILRDEELSKYRMERDQYLQLQPEERVPEFTTVVEILSKGNNSISNDEFETVKKFFGDRD